MTDIKITQADAEVLKVGDPEIKVTQADVEVLKVGSPDIIITQADVEILVAIEEEAGRVGSFFLFF